ncbi:hypothetical protein LZ198_15800 [Myxococcus sp. K15C18031901]|uniref:hypothetical protein n=1 Tax=Myxococcus dinghuensis TaxID=2906761 RepID=UPI0020A75796|nr:hypothetical protein [Myxococcus dinghuensis]MCP3100333.1 hypothetical protein [Myxococcus dinghuensis]
MSFLRSWIHLSAVTLAFALPQAARAQTYPSQGYPEPAPAQPAYPSAQGEDPVEPSTSRMDEDPSLAPPSAQQPLDAPPVTAQPQGMSEAGEGPATTSDAPVLRPEPTPLRTAPSTTFATEEKRVGSPLQPVSVDNGAILDGQRRQGPFLSGPGSFKFIAHHTTLGALGGFFTQAFANDFSFDKSSREAMLAGTLIGAGLGFGASSWWQFNNWVDRPMASFTIGNSVVGGMFMAGFMDLFSQDAGVLTWSAFLGAELGAWLTAGLGGGQLPLNDGLLVSSGAGWGAAYAALLLAVVHFSGTDISSKTWRDALLLAPGIGAGALALATMRYDPTPSQILRADLFGAGVGGAVLLISGLVLGGFNQSTPYVLSFLGSAGAITTVSLLWEESVDRSSLKSARDRQYKNVWW